jgi:hypothetical protein
MPSSGLIHRVALVRIDVSEECIISLTRIGDLGATLAVASNRSTPHGVTSQMTVFFIRFEIFTAVTMKKGVFWDVTPCGSCKNRRFGGN